MIEQGIDPEIDRVSLAGPVSTWTGNRGRDISHEPDGVESTSYCKRIEIRSVWPVSNAGE